MAGALARGAQDLLEDESFDRKPSVQLPELDLFLDMQEIVESAVELGRVVIGGLAEGLFEDERVVRRSRLQVGYGTAAVADGARLQQPAPVAHQRVEQPGGLAPVIQEGLEHARHLTRPAARQR